MEKKHRDKPAPDARAPQADNAAHLDAALADSGDSGGLADSAEIQRLKTDLEESGDRVLRAQAELENYRKRARRELDDERRYANLPLLRDLLPVLDNIQRAIAAAEKSAEGSVLLEGFKMVLQAFEGVLARHQCRRIEALGKPFDPTYHEAISQQPSAEVPPNTVVMVVQDGFMLHDRVVRPAQVIVSTAPPTV